MDAIHKELDKVRGRLPYLLQPVVPGPIALGRRPTAGVFGTLDRLIGHFEQADAQLAAWHPDAPVPPEGLPPPPDLAGIAAQLESAVDASQRTASAYQKDVYGALAKFGKATEKMFPTSASDAVDPHLFSSPPAREALKCTVSDHFLRSGDRDLFHLFAEEANVAVNKDDYSTYSHLNLIQRALERGDLDPAIAWASTYRDTLKDTGSSLEYALHRSRFLSLALGHSVVDHSMRDGVRPSASCSAQRDAGGAAAPPPMLGEADTEMMDAPQSVSEQHSVPGWALSSFSTIDCSSFRSTNVELALNYGRKHLSRFADAHMPEIQKMFAMLLFMPTCVPEGHAYSAATQPWGGPCDMGPIEAQEVVSFLPRPYQYFFDPNQTGIPYLVPLFVEAYCRAVGVPRYAPLKVATDIGANGTLHKILRVRAVMKESRTDWSQADELPVEVPLPPHLHFHSIFCCPVSKEQGSDKNPPMLMACGHVVCKESLINLAKGSSYVFHPKFHLPPSTWCCPPTDPLFAVPRGASSAPTARPSRQSGRPCVCTFDLSLFPGPIRHTRHTPHATRHTLCT